MPHTVATLPEPQRAALASAYDQAVAARRRQLLLGLAIGLFALAVAVRGAEVDPVMFWAKLGNFSSYFDRLLTLDTGARVWTDPTDWFWGLHRWLRLLGETVLIAYVGTLSGTLIAFAACFVASRNLVRSALLRMAVRRVLELLRTVPDIVFAMIFVVAFGLGPLPGVLALTLHSAGTLGKLFTEVVESIDLHPVEGVAATGGRIGLLRRCGNRPARRAWSASRYSIWALMLRRSSSAQRRNASNRRGSSRSRNRLLPAMSLLDITSKSC